MKEVKYKKVRERRLKMGLSVDDFIQRVNVLRKERGAKEIAPSTYYKKETGEIPFFLNEIEDFARVLGKNYKIFFE